MTKKNKTKTLFSIIFTAILCACFGIVISFAVSAAELTPTDSGSCGDNVIWDYYESTGELKISGSGEMYDPGSLPLPWHSYRSDIKSVYVSDGITSICKDAFKECPLLTSVEIASSVTYIGNNAFSNCSSLVSIELPSGITKIGSEAFAGCSSLISIDIPSSVTYIGEWAFWSCSALKIVTFQKNSQPLSIGPLAFYGCSSLESMTLLSDEPPELGEWALDSSSIKAIFVPASIAYKYNWKDNWKNYKSIIVPFDAVISFSKAKTQIGETLDITLSIENDPGIRNAEIILQYDREALDLKKIESDEELTALDENGKFTWMSGETFEKDRVLATFTFEINENARLKDYIISATVNEAKGSDNGEMLLAVSRGEISVLDFVYGDADGNKDVGALDLVLLRRHMADYDYSTGASSVDVSHGADANGDGKIGVADVLLMRKYMANYDYTEGTSSVVLGPEAEEQMPLYVVRFIDAEAFENENGDTVVISEVIVREGDSARIPRSPYHKGYVFTGWDVDCPSSVTADTVITAQYRTLDKYIVEFYDDHDGNLICSMEVSEGGSVVIEKPYKAGFIFKGWDKPVDCVDRKWTDFEAYEHLSEKELDETDIVFKTVALYEKADGNIPYAENITFQLKEDEKDGNTVYIPVDADKFSEEFAFEELDATKNYSGSAVASANKYNKVKVTTSYVWDGDFIYGYAVVEDPTLLSRGVEYCNSLKDPWQNDMLEYWYSLGTPVSEENQRFAIDFYGHRLSAYDGSDGGYNSMSRFFDEMDYEVKVVEETNTSYIFFKLPAKRENGDALGAGDVIYSAIQLNDIRDLNIVGNDIPNIYCATSNHTNYESGYERYTLGKKQIASDMTQTPITTQIAVTTQVPGTTQALTTQTPVSDKWADVDFKGATVVIGLNCWDSPAEINAETAVSIKYICGPDEYTGFSAQNAVYERNKKAKEELGLNISYLYDTYAVGETLSMIENFVLADMESAPDIIHAPGYDMVRAGIKGYLHNALTENEGDNYFELTDSNGWYTDFMLENTLDKSKMFLLAGDYFFDAIRHSYGTLVNTEMYEELFLSDGGIDHLYENVQDGKWTYDELVRCTDAAYVDNGIVGAEDIEDVFGFAADPSLYYRNFFATSGLDIFEEKNGEIVYREDVSDVHTFVDKLIGIFSRDSVLDPYGDVERNHGAINIFISGNSLFALDRPVLTLEGTKADGMNGVGIIPSPKYNESAEYKALVSDNANLGGILYNSDKFTESSAFLQMLCEESYGGKGTLVYEYFDTELKYKQISDDQQMTMLEIIRNGICSPKSFLFDEYLADNADCDSYSLIMEKNIKAETNNLANDLAARYSDVKKSLEDTCIVFGVNEYENTTQAPTATQVPVTTQSPVVAEYVDIALIEEEAFTSLNISIPADWEIFENDDYTYSIYCENIEIGQIFNCKYDCSLDSFEFINCSQKRETDLATQVSLNQCKLTETFFFRILFSYKDKGNGQGYVTLFLRQDALDSKILDKLVNYSYPEYYEKYTHTGDLLDSSGAHADSVLICGNSFVGSSRISAILQNMCTSGGIDCDITAISRGFARVSTYTSDATVMSDIRNGKYEAVFMCGLYSESELDEIAKLKNACDYSNTRLVIFPAHNESRVAIDKAKTRFPDVYILDWKAEVDSIIEDGVDFWLMCINDSHKHSTPLAGFVGAHMIYRATFGKEPPLISDISGTITRKEIINNLSEYLRGDPVLKDGFVYYKLK